MAWMVSLKILLISSGVVSLALAMKESVPLLLEFILSHLPQIWSSFLSWLRPPYLYVIINGIIITIAATSRFQHNRPDTKPSPPKVVSEDLGYDHPAKFDVLEQPEVVYELREEKPTEYEQREEVTVTEVKTVVVSEDLGYGHPAKFDVLEQPEVVYELREEKPTEYEQREEVTVTEVKTVVVDNGTAEAEDEDEDEDEDDDEDEDENEEEFVISRSAWTPPIRSDSSEILLPAEKPLVSARFGHRKPVKSSPEGVRMLRVTKPKRHETLENTWKAITEGRSIPLSRHMKKCDTWENHGRLIDVSQVDPFQVKKSETFKDRTNEPPGSGRLRKEPSLSQDDLNRRVEAFINKFNEEMRLQRQESLNQYMEMINRGSH